MESHDDEIEYRDKDCDVIDDNGNIFGTNKFL